MRYTRRRRTPAGEGTADYRRDEAPGDVSADRRAGFGDELFPRGVHRAPDARGQRVDVALLETLRRNRLEDAHADTPRPHHHPPGGEDRRERTVDERDDGRLRSDGEM